MLTPEEILEQAKGLPNDEARRQLAHNVRMEAANLDFDERQERMGLADKIDALCTTPDAPKKE